MIKKIALGILLGTITTAFTRTITLKNPPGTPERISWNNQHVTINLPSHPYTDASTIEESSFKKIKGINTIQEATIVGIAGISVYYWFKANKAIKILSEQLNSTDNDKNALIEALIDLLKKGNQLVQTTLIITAVGLVTWENNRGFNNITNIFDNVVIKNTLSGSFYSIKAGIAYSCFKALNQGIIAIQEKLNANSEAGKSIIKGSDVALAVLDSARILALIIMTSNGIDAMAIISSPLWLK